MTTLANRYDFLFLFDCENGNPNGDPDTGNAPRQDPETSRGLVTDVCLKRKIRNFVHMLKGGAPGFDIYIKERAILETVNRGVFRDLGIPYPTDEDAEAEEAPEAEAPEAEEAPEAPEAAKGKKGGKGKKAANGNGNGRSKVATPENQEKVVGELARRYYDIRTFGAVTGRSGRLRGPVQLTFSESFDPILPMENTITRVCITSEKDQEKRKETTMGNKVTIPYGLYRGYGFISPMQAQKTGFTTEDLDLFWSAFRNMFEVDRSAGRGLMSLRKLVAFKHASPLGNASARRLFDLLSVTRKNPSAPARAYSDYSVELAPLPAGVDVEVLDLTDG